jgi:predicted glycoside hydrolase/deacetylase ChbG (UPF0249 family)
MTLAMIQANVEENWEAAMDRFMNGFNHDITHIVVLHHYVEYGEMVHMVVKMKKQLKQKGGIHQSLPSCPSKP